jgi:acetoin utilization protein AcuB
MKTPPISEFMSRSPWTIGADQPLAAAHRMMRRHDIRHLPVLRGGSVVGVVSQRDLHLIETLQDVDPEEVPVEEAMSQDVFAVPPDAPIDEVAEVMAARKLGCAIVGTFGHVEGIFTTVDALLALTWRFRVADEDAAEIGAAQKTGYSAGG